MQSDLTGTIAFDPFVGCRNGVESVFTEKKPCIGVTDTLSNQPRPRCRNCALACSRGGILGAGTDLTFQPLDGPPEGFGTAAEAEALTGNLQRFGFEKAGKTESLPEIIESMDEDLEPWSRKHRRIGST